MEGLGRALLEWDPSRAVGWPGRRKIQGKHLVLLSDCVAALTHHATLNIELRPGSHIGCAIHGYRSISGDLGMSRRCEKGVREEKGSEEHRGQHVRVWDE